MSDVSEIASQLTHYLNETICPPTVLDPQTDLLEIGVVDSLMIMELVTHVESSYGIHVAAGEITPRNFRSMHNLGELIHSKLNRPSGVASVP